MRRCGMYHGMICKVLSKIFRKIMCIFRKLFVFVSDRIPGTGKACAFPDSS